MRQRASARTYITKRTLGRPRDVVAFAVFAKRAADANGKDRIEAADIYAGEKAYSKHVLDELRDEVERHVDDFQSVVNSLKTIGKRNFAAEDWYAAATENGLKRKDAATPWSDCSRPVRSASTGPAALRAALARRTATRTAT